MRPIAERIGKTRRLCRPIVLLLLAWTAFPRASAGADGEVDLYIVAGQSNAVGYDARPSELPDDPNDAKVMFWWRTGDPPPDEHDSAGGGMWTTLRPQPLGNPKQPRDSKQRQYGNFAQPEGGFGPEIGFARALLAAYPDRRIAIVKVAFSGTGIARDWDPRSGGEIGACYRALVEEVKEARAAAAAQGIPLRPRGLLWVQGESDANADDAPKYAGRLGRMATAFREDIAAPELKVLVAVNERFKAGDNPHIAAIIAAQKEAAARDPRLFRVDASAASVANEHHFDAKGTLDLGRWFAEALLKE